MFSWLSYGNIMTLLFNQSPAPKAEKSGASKPNKRADQSSKPHTESRDSLLKATSTLFAGLLAACTHNVNEQPYDEYLKLSPPGTFTSINSEPRLEGFIKIFSDFQYDEIDRSLDEVYAENFYFNDTFHTFHERAKLKKYFLSLADKAETRIDFLDYSSQDDQVWLRWKMKMSFQAWWRSVQITSIGVTHLKFDNSGKIILHQDYWDGVEGFYSHLPIVGSMLKSVRSKLGDSE